MYICIWQVQYIHLFNVNVKKVRVAYAKKFYVSFYYKFIALCSNE